MFGCTTIGEHEHELSWAKLRADEETKRANDNALTVSRRDATISELKAELKVAVERASAWHNALGVVGLNADLLKAHIARQKEELKKANEMIDAGHASLKEANKRADTQTSSTSDWHSSYMHVEKLYQTQIVEIRELKAELKEANKWTDKNYNPAMRAMAEEINGLRVRLYEADKRIDELEGADNQLTKPCRECEATARSLEATTKRLRRETIRAEGNWKAAERAEAELSELKGKLCEICGECKTITYSDT